MGKIIKFKQILLFFLLMICAQVIPMAAATAAPILLNESHLGPIGLSTGFYQETQGRLTLDEAINAFDSGRFSPSDKPVLNFGIGSKPVWIHFSVENTSPQPLRRRLSIETPWLDHINLYFRHDGKTVTRFQVGDTEDFAARPINNRFFAFDHDFVPGLSEVFIRVQTPDTMVLPIRLMPPDQARALGKAQDYSYGFMYGFLFALMIYNVMLYLGLKDARYILYSLYLGMFLLMNISYTGHGFEWLWPTNPHWEQWSIPIFMTLYGASGLLFALRFLDIRKHFPRLCQVVPSYLGLVGILMLLTILFDSQYAALLLAFGFVFLFIGIMLFLGVITLRTGEKSSRYFLLATFSAMVGAFITTLANWGAIPFNTWTFRAVDLGMLIDATLLALALTYQFKIGQEAMFHAEQMAMLDPLTGINNRRAFRDKATPVWNIAQRQDRDLSIIMFDLDHFKLINDKYGHACGDKALIATADILKASSRTQDVIARWGGEEFILLLPETGCPDAILIAKRLRADIAALRLHHENHEIRMTASFGVGQRDPQHQSLDALISTADNFLYQAKDDGRNRVGHTPVDIV